MSKKISKEGKFIRVGLTGGLGTGKTTVAGLLKNLGAVVVDADLLAHALLKKGSKQYGQVIRTFGKEIADKSGRISRRRLARKVFGHPRRLDRLNRIIHPEVLKKLKGKLDRGSKPVRVAVIPLLYEVGMENWFDYTIVVTAGRRNVHRRLGANRKMSEEEIESRRQAQFPLTRKLARADYVINNNGTLSSTRKQTRSVWNKLVRGSGR